MHKKFIFSLLGGGVAVIAASFGGIELNKKLDYDKKISSFGKVSKEFNSRVKELMQDESWYLPNWEDKNAWQKQHNRGWNDDNSGTREGFRKRYPTADSLRDHCFEFLKTKMNECRETDERCVECIRGKNWS